jgi:hemerythrin-like domain-containing protein
LDDLKQKWENEEDNLLYSIIHKDATAKWNEVAKELFLSSNKKYLRTSKQCRERWLNHLDPNKTKCEWSLK